MANIKLINIFILKTTLVKMKTSIVIYCNIRKNLLKEEYENLMKKIGLNGVHQEILVQ